MNLLLKRNEGPLDRIVRIVAGLFLLSLTFLWPETPWGWVGLVPLFTGLVGSCPLYSLLGFRTCSLPR
jgi:hypothetical protein